MIRRFRPTLTPIGALLLLAGCGQGDDAPGTAGLTVGENQRIDAAAARLDARAPSPATAASVQLEQQIRDRLSAEAQAAPAPAR